MAPFILPIVLASAALAAGPAGSADADVLRLDFSEPALMISPGGRTGACDQLRFDRSGDRLFAVGDDKVVHRWDVTAGGLDYRPPLRWNVYRERRGAIYAMAISPDERFVAVGGYGRKDADVVVIDRESGRTVQALSAETHPGYGAGGVVWSLTFDPSGTRLAVGLEDGSVWDWDRTAAEPTAARVAPPDPDPDRRAGRLAKVVWVGFVGDLVRFVRGDGLVAEAAAGRPVRDLFRFGAAVAGVVAHPDGDWLAARPLRQTPTGTTVEVRGLPGGQTVRAIEYRKNERNEQRLLPVTLAVDATGRRLAVGTAWVIEDTEARTARSGDVRIYDLRSNPPVLTAYATFDGDDGRPAATPDALAFHPDGERLAIAGGFDHETSLWKIDDGTLARVGPPSVGVGRPVWQVATADAGTKLGLRQQLDPASTDANARGRGDWAWFDLARLGWDAEETGPPETAVAELNGWRVEKDGTSEFAWVVVHESGFRYPLAFDKAADDRPSCYTFLPAASARRVRLAVGHYWGMTVFEVGRGYAPRRVARGVGHQGVVTSIAPAKDGKLLVTGSTDQTACLWALAPWDGTPGLGATFDWQFDPITTDRSFVVTAVQDGSPAWECGLLRGDRIRKLGYDVAWVENPDAWAAAVASAEPGRELAFLIDRPSGDGFVRTAAKTRLLSRPQARFFPAANSPNREWVLYRYADHYYAAGAGGDAHLGWLVGGRTARDTPEFFPATQFQPVFDRPDKVRETATTLARTPDRVPVREFAPPNVRVEASADQTVDTPVEVTIKVRPQVDETGRPIPVEKVGLWLDDEVLLYEWALTRDEGSAAVTKAITLRPGQFRVGRNRLSAVAYAKAAGTAAVDVTHTPAARSKATFRGLAVGVDRYPYLPADRQLQASASDARLIRDGFARLAGSKNVATADIDVLVDDAATPAAILAAIDTIAEELKPDDWFVLYLAGHGFADGVTGPDGGRGPGPEAATGGPVGWYFCGFADWQGQPLSLTPAAGGRGLAAGLVKAGGVLSGSDLLGRLARLNCRKLVLIDSCHSGAVAQDPGRELRPGGRGAIILTAAAPYEAASEYLLPIDRDGRTVVERHGFFSAALYKNLTPDTADQNQDGVVTMEELHRAISGTVTASRADANLNRPGAPTQTVIMVPSDNRDTVIIDSR